MAKSIENLRSRLQTAIAPGFRGRLLDKGLARGLIWRDGELPADAPAFQSSLIEDLLDYAHTVFSMALRLRTDERDSILDRALLVAGESMESAVHRGSDSIETGFHRVSAAVAFHLARYSDRAYSMLPTANTSKNLVPTEEILVQLLRRKLDDMHGFYSSWLLDGQHGDEQTTEKIPY